MAIDLTALNNACVLYYSMDNADVSGSTILDLTPNNNDGTINGATTGVTGILNEAISLDGVGDYVDTNINPSTVIGPGDFIVNMWINPTKTDTFDRYFQMGTTTSQVSDSISFFSGYNYLAYYAEVGGTEGSVRESTQSISTSIWQMVTLIRSGSTIKLYYNANEVLSNTDTDNTVSAFTKLYIGSSTDLSAYYEGKFDKITVLGNDWTTVGTAQELVDYFYNQGAPTVNQQYPFSPNATYAIEGQVTLSGTATQGATLRLYDQTGSTYEGSTTTDVNGNYLFDNLTDGNEYHVSVEYDDGTNKYNSKSKPYVIPVEENI